MREKVNLKKKSGKNVLKNVMIFPDDALSGIQFGL